MDALISVRDLCFTYADGSRVIDGLSFTAAQGECVAVLGANGCGKTTLLYCLAGVIPNIVPGAISGELRVCNTDPSTGALDDLVRNVAFVQQDPESQIVATTVRAECAFGPSNLGIGRDEIQRRIEDALATVGLQSYDERQTATLSYGQKQRLTIAAALTTAPRVLLLDEPLANIDWPARRQILSVLDGLKRQAGVSMVITVHDLGDLQDLMDYVLVMGPKGRQLALLHVDDLASNSNILKAAKVSVPPLLSLGLRIGLRHPPNLVDSVCRALASRSTGNVVELPVPNASALTPTAPGAPTAPAKASILRAVNLSFSYDSGPPILDRINLEVFEGEIMGILGPNGSGKTTLIKQFNALLRPSNGQVLYRGQNIRHISVGELAHEIGTVTQNPETQLVYANTLLEEVEYGLERRPKAPPPADFTATQALDLVGLSHKAQLFPGKLSYGEKKKLLIACLIARGPNVLVLDEPFFGLDFSGKTGLTSILQSLRRAGRTIVAVTHDTDAITESADRLVVLFDGKIVLNDLPPKVLWDPRLEDYGIFRPSIVQLAMCLAKNGVESRFVPES